MSSVVLAPYTFHEVNELPHIDVSSEVELEDHVMKLAPLVLDGDLAPHLAISRLHHHYLLQEDESIVVRVADAMSSRLNRPGQEEIAAKGPILIKEPRKPRTSDIPYIFRFVESSAGEADSVAVMPLEFISGADVPADVTQNLRLALKAVFERPDVIDSLRAKIFSTGMNEHLGFQLVFEHSLLQPGAGEHVQEDNWERYQEVACRPVDPTVKQTTTSWRFKLINPSDPTVQECICLETWTCGRTSRGHVSIYDGHGGHFN